MITYDNLLKEALDKLPDFAKEYDRLIKKDIIDLETGNHIIFSYAFVPLLVQAIKTNNYKVRDEMLSFLEEMASSQDRLVTEVCDFTILEELHGEIKDKDLYPLLQGNTRDGFLTIMQYMNYNP